MASPSVHLIIPTLNEEEAISSVIRAARLVGPSDITVIDGHSTDSTVKASRELGCRVMVQDGRGKGMAFQTFLKRARPRPDDLYIMLDGDGTYDPADIPRFAKALKRSEVVSGNRTNIREFGAREILHFLGNRLISFLGFLLYGRWADICTGYWGFRGSALRKMRITARRFELEADLFANSALLRLKYSQIPIKYSKRKGRAKLGSSDALWILSHLVWKRLS